MRGKRHLRDENGEPTNEPTPLLPKDLTATERLTLRRSKGMAKVFGKNMHLQTSVPVAHLIGHKEAFLLSMLYEAQDMLRGKDLLIMRFVRNGKKEIGYWFYCTRKRIEQRTNFSTDTQKRLLTKLADKGLLHIRMVTVGGARRRYFCLDDGNLIDLVAGFDPPWLKAVANDEDEVDEVMEIYGRRREQPEPEYDDEFDDESEEE